VLIGMGIVNRKTAQIVEKRAVLKRTGRNRRLGVRYYR